MELEEVRVRLKQLGYTDISAYDDAMIRFTIDKVEGHVKSFCNLTTVPTDLSNEMIDAVCGDFLSTKKSIGNLTGYDLEKGVSSVKIGDTSVNFSGMSEDERFDLLTSTLQSGLDGELVCYRKLKW